MALSLFKKNKNSIPGNGTNYYALKVKEIRKETPDASTIIFENPADKIHYKPGQFLTLILNYEGESIRRSYSLSSSPYHDAHLAITVKKIEGGVASKIIFDTVHVGDFIDVMEPMGSFTTEIDPERRRSMILFAAGSGITTLMSILKSVLLSEKESEILLV